MSSSVPPTIVNIERLSGEYSKLSMTTGLKALASSEKLTSKTHYYTIPSCAALRRFSRIQSSLVRISSLYFAISIIFHQPHLTDSTAGGDSAAWNDNSGAGDWKDSAANDSPAMDFGSGHASFGVGDGQDGGDAGGDNACRNCGQGESSFF